MYFCVQGQAFIHIPHIVADIPISFDIFLALSQHLKASNIISLSSPAVQFLPTIANAGQRSTHLSQVPQQELSIGSPTSNSASVSTVARRTAEPYFSVTSSADFPIQPNPARVAAVLCWNFADSA